MPGIPSAKEVEKYGVSLGEMNAKLLKKVEEMMLYLIAKDKQYNQQKQQLEKQAAELMDIKQMLLLNKK